MPEPVEANRLVLTARITALSALRYTPAGLPALDLELEQRAGAKQAIHFADVVFDLLFEFLQLRQIARLGEEVIGDLRRVHGIGRAMIREELRHLISGID